MPAGRLTADCIWNSFRSSGKRHLFLTGTRGSGKTTLLKQLFPRTLPGLTTWAKQKQAVYLRNNLTSETVQVGVFDATLPGPGNQMVLLQDGFASVGVTTLERCMESDSSWVSIDEIGYLEALCEPYHEALRQLLEQKQVAAVIRKQELPFLTELCNREDAFVVDLDDPFGNIGCVIMASGLGKRFGGNKLMADFAGEPMICRALSATEGLFASRVVVTRHEDVASLCRERGLSVVLHDLPDRSDTIRLGLDALGDVDACLFCPGDQPLLSRSTVAALCECFRNNREKIVRPVFAGTPGAPVLFPAWAFAELSALPRGKGGQYVISCHPEAVAEVPVSDPDELTDADTPQALEHLRAISGK